MLPELRRIDVTRIDATYRCNPKDGPSCGAEVPVGKVTCPACRKGQVRPNAPIPTGRLISNAVLYDDGTPVALVTSVSKEAAGFLTAMTKWAHDEVAGPSQAPGSVPRLSGIGDRQRMFGTLAPQPLRKRYGCRRSHVTRGTDPDAWAEVAAEAHGILEAALPDVAARNVALADPIGEPWKFPGTGWTSGVLNLTQLLPFHRDAGNLAGSWSGMVGARSAVDGGHLYLPEYDLTLEVGNRSLICFPGGMVTHGVTPMTVKRGGWRVTAVFYGLRGCLACAATEAEELTRMDRRATELNRAMAQNAPEKAPGAPESNAPAVVAPTPRPTRPTPVDKTEAERLEDLAEFARLMIDSRDLEPWAGVMAELRRTGAITYDEAVWLVKLYNAFDSLGSAWGVFRRWPSHDAWRDAPDRSEAADFPCTQERRGLRGGKVLIHLASYVNAIAEKGADGWLRTALRTGRPGADFLVLNDHVRAIWGVGRQTAFEWAEFLAKVCDYPITATSAMLWESEGPRRALQRLYGNPTPTAQWLDRRASECKSFLAERGVDLAWEDFETVICDFNVGRDGRYYVGRHLAALAEEIADLPDPADRRLLEAAFDAYVPAPWSGIKPGIDPAKMPVYRDTGKLIDQP